MSSGKPLTTPFVSMLLVLSALSAGCSGNPDGGSATGSAATASPTASAPTTGRDGRTLLPTGSSVACGLLDDAAIKSTLGPVAGSLQPAQPVAERMPAGVTHDSCLHPFDAGGASTNALTVQVITYPSAAEATAADPFGMLNAPEDVPGLKNEAKYSMIPLSGSTEFVIVSLDGARIVKLIVALPPDAAWEPAAGRETMLELARTAQL